MLEPLKVTIKDLPEDIKIKVPNFPADEKKGFHTVPFRKTVYIEQEDFREVG